MKVLLATEGSEFSKAALDKVCDMFARSDNAEIRILSAAEPTFVPMEPFAVSAEYVADATRVAVENAENAVQTAEKRIRNALPDLGGRLTTKVAQDKPAQAIVEEAENWGADVIVMGSHGYGFWQRTFLGSVSNAVVHHAPCSVLVVRPDRNGDES